MTGSASGTPSGCDPTARSASFDQSISSQFPFDWKRTLAFAPHQDTAAMVYVNSAARQGLTRDSAPLFTPRQIDDACQAAAQALGEARHPETGQPLFPQIIPTAQAYHLDPAREGYPDLIALPDDPYWVRTRLTGDGSWVTPDPNLPGTHRPEGIVALAGAGLAPGRSLKARLIDVTPTILSLLGLPVPAHVEGRAHHRASHGCRAQEHVHTRSARMPRQSCWRARTAARSSTPTRSRPSSSSAWRTWATWSESRPVDDDFLGNRLGLPRTRCRAIMPPGTQSSLRHLAESELRGMMIPKPTRTIAIGDIHGCSAALRAILDAIRPMPDDLIVTLGDYVDRGPDSRGVLERLIELAGECRLVPILGNHDDMLIQALDGLHATTFLAMGGTATLASYGGSAPEDLQLDPRGTCSSSERVCQIFTKTRHISSFMGAMWPICR